MTAVHERPALSVNLPARPLTLDDVAELAAADDVHRYELDGGNLVVMSPTGAVHAQLIMRIGTWLMQHGYAERSLATPGVRTKSNGGRSPDVAVVREPITEDVVWIDPANVLLAVEIVLPGSERADRYDKPVEYAAAGIPHYWRVERDGAATVHLFDLGVGAHGEPFYVLDEVVLLDKLLAGEPPKLG